MNTENIMQYIYNYAPRVATALVILIVGFWIIGRLNKYIGKTISRSGLDDTLTNFLTSLISVGMKIMLLLSVASKFGVDTTSFIAILGALTVGIGMALNGSIGHFASCFSLTYVKEESLL